MDGDRRGAMGDEVRQGQEIDQIQDVRGLYEVREKGTERVGGSSQGLSGSLLKTVSKTTNWQETTVGKFAPFKYGKGLPKKKRNSMGTVPVYGSNSLVGKHNAYFVKGPTIIVGRKGTIGAVHFSQEHCWPIDTTIFVEQKPDRDIRFTYYLLQSLGLESMNADSAVPGLNRDAAHALKIKVPPLKEQQAIAQILSSLDDKIELNRHMNQTLEATAQAIFKSWFVDFDPVRAKAEGRQPEGMDAETAELFPDGFVESELGEIPRGWQLKPLDQIANFLNGVACQKYPPSGENDLPVIKIRELRQGITEASDNANSHIPAKYDKSKNSYCVC